MDHLYGMGTAQQASAPHDVSQAIGKFLEPGLVLLESLSSPRHAAVSEGSEYSAQVERSLSDIFLTDARNHRTALVIPLPASVTAERLASVIGGLLGKLAGSQ